MAESKTEREPKALSTEYHKARKQLMLWAGVLFIWELVGIDLERAKEAGGNAGAIITAIKSPQAVPWVLLILVAYFLFKVTVEWYQCPAARRSLRVSRVDFASAWIVSLTAYALYLYQAVKKVQFADVVQVRTGGPMPLASGGSVGFVMTWILLIFINNKYEFWKSRGKLIFYWHDLILVVPLLASLLFVVMLRILGATIYWASIVTGLLIGVAGAVLFIAVMNFGPLITSYLFKVISSYRKQDG